MLEIEKEKMKEFKIQQEEINHRLLNIARMLKSISTISMNYMEYMSALIYVIYENRHNLKHGYIQLQRKGYILEEIDYELQKIRNKEKSEKLFKNIRFLEKINEQNYLSFIKVIRELSELILELECMNENNKPIIAKAFEYIIMKAAQENEISFNNEEYYTPKGLVKTMVKLLNIRDKMAIYNPACGTGNFITESAKHANIYAFGEENDISNYNICITNLWLHDIYNKRIKINSNEKFQEVDIAIANPPFVDNVKKNIKMDEDLERLYYNNGISPTASSYVKHMIMMLKSTHKYGKMAIILPHGFLFKKTNDEYRLRQELIKKNYIDAIIGLPEKLFYNTKIPVVILIIDKAKKREEILFINASKEYTSKRKTNILAVENQQKIIDTYLRYESIEGYSYIANAKEIEQNDYDLNINKYIHIKSKIKEINQEEIKERLNFLEHERCEIQEKIARLISDVSKPGAI